LVPLEQACEELEMEIVRNADAIKKGLEQARVRVRVVRTQLLDFDNIKVALELLESLPSTMTAQWMWGDVGLLGLEVAKKDPLRWSHRHAVNEVIPHLERHLSGRSSGRPVIVRYIDMATEAEKAAGDQTTTKWEEASFSTVAEAVAGLQAKLVEMGQAS